MNDLWIAKDVFDYYFLEPEIFKDRSEINFKEIIHCEKIHPKKRLMFFLYCLDDDNLIKQIIKYFISIQFTKEDLEFLERIGQTLEGKLWLVIDLLAREVTTDIRNNYNNRPERYDFNYYIATRSVLYILYNTVEEHLTNYEICVIDYCPCYMYKNIIRRK